MVNKRGHNPASVNQDSGVIPLNQRPAIRKPGLTCSIGAKSPARARKPRFHTELEAEMIAKLFRVSRKRRENNRHARMDCINITRIPPSLIKSFCTVLVAGSGAEVRMELQRRPVKLAKIAWYMAGALSDLFQEARMQRFLQLQLLVPRFTTAALERMSWNAWHHCLSRVCDATASIPTLNMYNASAAALSSKGRQILHLIMDFIRQRRNVVKNLGC